MGGVGEEEFAGGAEELAGGAAGVAGGAEELAGGADGLACPGPGAGVPGVASPGAGGVVGVAGEFAGTCCDGTVGGATGVALCTLTRTLSTSESTSSTENLLAARSLLRRTLAPSPASTLYRWPRRVDSARRILLATPVSFVPDSTNTVTSTGALPTPGVTRNRSSPLDSALPLDVMFQESAMGGVLAACTAPVPNNVAQTAIDASTITQNLPHLESIGISGPARPDGFRGAPAV